MSLFSGERYAPEPVDGTENAREFISDAERYDIPDWLWPEFKQSLGEKAEAAAMALQNRAPVHLRVNVAKTDVAEAIGLLEADGITAVEHPACDTALEVTVGTRKISQCRAYIQGLVELQDAASQAVIAALPLQPGMRVLDYCAGGGGKALALAAHRGVQVYAHDANPGRMRDLPARAQRAGANISVLTSDDVEKKAPFDLVLTDVPCSGSGSWRRAPAGKWSLTAEQLKELFSIQTRILETASVLLKRDGTLAYATCSMLNAENEAVIATFLKENSDWSVGFQNTWLVTQGADGFFSAHLTRA